jgi:tRNA-dihydrouridine synthase
MTRTNKFQSFVRGMTSVLSARDKPFTVKMRTGIKLDKNIAHSLIEFCRDNGVAAVTVS